MIEPLIPANEPRRLLALQQTGLLDTPLEERFERITRLAQRLLGMPIAAISLIDADRQWYKSIQGHGVAETTRCVSFCGHAIFRDEPMIITDARLDPRFADNPLVTGPPNIVFYAGYPIRSPDGLNIAVMCVVDHRPRTFDEDQVQMLRDLAAIAENEMALSMQSCVQRELLAQIDEVHRRARVDELTRVWNRGAIFEILQAECARAANAREPVCVLMADIDRFKSINDTHGHAAGDEVLRQVAKRILSALRSVDALGRYGGEEFMIVLGGCGRLGEARKIAERVRQRIGACGISTEFGEIPVTLSIGLNYLDDARAADIATLVRNADEALYQAKNSGRDRVIVSRAGVRPAEAA